MEDDLCNNLQYNHPMPINWLQEVCEEIFEEKDVFGVLRFYEKITRLNFTPDESFPSMMCKEFYGCENEIDDDEL